MKKSSDFKNGCGGSHHSIFGFWDLRVKVLYGLLVEENTYAIVGVLGIEEQVGTLRFK
jgi:hypothetical protein